MRRHAFIKDSTLTFGARAASVVTLAIVGIMVARQLGPEGKGVVALALMVPQFLFSVLNFGFGTAAIYLTGRERYTPQELAGATVISGIVLGVLSIGVFPLFAGWAFSGPLRGVSPGLVWLALSSIPFLYLTVFMGDIFRANGMMNLYNGGLFCVSIFKVIAIAAVLYWMRAGELGVIIASWLGLFLLAAVQLVVVARRIGFARPPARAYKEMFAFGARVYSEAVLVTINGRVAGFILNNYVDPSAVGFFTTADGLAEVLWHVPIAIGLVFLPFTARQDDESAAKSTATLCRHTLWVVTAAAVLMVLAAPVVVPALYGPPFKAAVIPFMIMLPGVVLYSLMRVISTYLAGRGRPTLVMGLAAIVVASNLALSLLLTPRHGIMGASVAISVAYVLSAAAALWLFVGIGHVSPSSVLLLRRPDLEVYRGVASAAARKLRRSFSALGGNSDDA